MIHGIDTGFLVAAELVEHADHAWARQKLVDVLENEDRFAIAPQVIAEFIHIVTDSRRFAQPISFERARDLAEQWWTAADVDRCFLTRMRFDNSSNGFNNINWAVSDCWTRCLPPPTKKLACSHS